jgi:hypothetical protein
LLPVGTSTFVAPLSKPSWIISTSDGRRGESGRAALGSVFELERLSPLTAAQHAISNAR